MQGLAIVAFWTAYKREAASRPCPLRHLEPVDFEAGSDRPEQAALALRYKTQRARGLRRQYKRLTSSFSRARRDSNPQPSDP